MVKAQTTLKNAKVIKKIGNWTIELFTNSAGRSQFAVSDGCKIDYPIIYTENVGVGWDFPEHVPKSVHVYFEKNRNKLLKIKRSHPNG